MNFKNSPELCANHVYTHKTTTIFQWKGFATLFHLCSTHKNVVSVGNRFPEMKNIWKNLNSSQLGMNLFQPRRCSTNLCMLCQLRIFFFGSGKGLDKLVMITKIFFSVEQKIKKLHSFLSGKAWKKVRRWWWWWNINQDILY